MCTKMTEDCPPETVSPTNPSKYFNKSLVKEVKYDSINLQYVCCVGSLFTYRFQD